MENQEVTTDVEIDAELDILEERVKYLEDQILGGMKDVDSSVNIVDILLKSMTLTSAAISSREKMALMVKRLSVWDKILDPLFEEALMDQSAKSEEIELVGKDLKEIITDFKKIKDMYHVFDSDKILEIPKAEDRLNNLAGAVYSNEEKVKELKSNLNDLVKRYGNVCDDFSKAFTVLNEVVTELEINAQPKKVVE